MKKNAQLRTTRQVIDALGGTEVVADMTRSDVKTVYHWALRHIPAEWYVAMQAALKKLDLSAPPKLWGMKVGKPPSKKFREAMGLRWEIAEAKARLKKLKGESR